MTLYTLFSLLLTLAVAIGYLNHHFIKLQPSIAIMSGAVILSSSMMIASHFGWDVLRNTTIYYLSHINFKALLIEGFLSFFLFAGALNIDWNELKSSKWEIGILAMFSTTLSTFSVGYACYFILPYLHLSMPLMYCLLFGALISPTDPIAVLAILKQVRAPSKIYTTLAGESLFNDGIGIVLFLSFYRAYFSGHLFSMHFMLFSFIQQVLGGVSYGIVLGILCHRLIKIVDDHKIEILVTLAVTTGGYALAQNLNISGPLAMVVAGIIVGNGKKNFSLNKKSREQLHLFWELVDEILNTLLFLLIGLELMTIPIDLHKMLAGCLAILLVLLARTLAVTLPAYFFQLKNHFSPYTTRILIWGGLRGGLAIALALSMPNDIYRHLVMTMTYCVVAFSIIVQGITIKPLLSSSAKEKQ